jgi:hypothetical protein
MRRVTCIGRQLTDRLHALVLMLTDRWSYCGKRLALCSASLDPPNARLRHDRSCAKRRLCRSPSRSQQVAVEAGGTPKAYYHYAAAGEEEAVSLFAKRSASNLQMAQDKMGDRDRASTIAEAMYQQLFSLKCASLHQQQEPIAKMSINGIRSCSHSCDAANVTIRKD